MKLVKLNSRELPYEIAEALKTLRTNIRFCGNDKRVILFTSCISGEGKSTVSLDLTISLTELGYSAILVDADLRKSQLAGHLASGHFEQGLTHYLAHQCGLDDITYATNIPGFYIIPAGALPPNPSELLDSVRMQGLIKELRSSVDFIIVDCAPLGLVVDAAVVAPHCDGSILLIEADGISYRLAQEVVARLKATGCPVLGSVLNKVNHEKGRYYGYGRYGKYGRYYGQ